VSIAPFGRRALPVIANDEVGAYRVLRVADPDGPAPDAGQFTMLASVEHWGGGADERPLLARAFSVARYADGEAHYLLEDVGPGTRRLCELRQGELVWALGPLGRGFTDPADGRRPLLVGGGIGIAPLAILQDQLRGGTALLGFRDARHAAGAALLSDPRIATDDGSAGHHGLVTDLLAAELDGAGAGGEGGAVVYACGPPPMLEAVRAMCAQAGVECQLALEAAMACGFGACFGCAVPKRGGGYVRVCVDGPVVAGELLDRVEDPGAGAPLAALAAESP